MRNMQLVVRSKVIQETILMIDGQEYDATEVAHWLERVEENRLFVTGVVVPIEYAKLFIDQGAAQALVFRSQETVIRPTDKWDDFFCDVYDAIYGEMTAYSEDTLAPR